MAVPRIFISSTFYDLKQVREDLERFIKELGYEPVRAEKGSIPYGKDASPENYAYREIELCDIVVSIVGGRFGSESHEEYPYSISQKELRTALERGIQVFIFVERNILAEYSTYQINKDNNEIHFRFVDDKRIYQFIDEIQKLPKNNPIAPFDTSADIVNYLRIQWAGLFQRFLQEQKRLSEMKVLEEMNSVAATLKQLVTFLTEERHKGDEAIRDILLSNHPIFQQLKLLLKVVYRIYFTNLDEMTSWLSARGFSRNTLSLAFLSEEELYIEFTNTQLKKNLKISAGIFDENERLKVYTPGDWKEEYILLEEIEEVKPAEDLPF